MARIVYTDISGQERSVPIGSQAPVVSIGRAVDCTIRSNRKSVSRRHAEFRFANNQFEIIDLNSSNGTYLIINDQRRPVMGREYVTHNDEVWCGDFILRFYDDAMEMPHQDHDSTLDGTDNVGRHPIATFDSIPPQNGAFGVQPNQPAFGNPNQSGFSDPVAQSHIGSGNQSGFGAPVPVDALNLTEPPQPQPQPPNQNWNQQSSWTDDPPNQNLQAHQGQGPPTFAEPPPQPANAQWSDSQGLDDGQSSWSEPVDSNFGLDDPSELERVQAEKRSIEDMAARQRSEIERLEMLIEDLREQSIGSDATAAADPISVPPADPTKAGVDQIDALSKELSDTRLENERLVEQLDASKQQSMRMDDLEREIDELRALNDTLRADLNDARENQHDVEKEQSMEAALEEKDGLIIELRATIDRLETTVQELESNVDSAASSSEQVQNELERLRDEVKRKERLVVEFERRNRELQHDLTVHEEAASTMEEQIDDLKDQLGSVDPEELLKAQDARTTAELALSLRTDEMEQLKEKIAELTAQLSATEASDSGADARVAELEAENQQLREALSHGVAVEQTVADSGPPLGELTNFLQNLERIVDALERTDLQPLTTVDRVRLQSAIRETDPKNTLERLLASLTS